MVESGSLLRSYRRQLLSRVRIPPSPLSDLHHSILQAALSLRAITMHQLLIDATDAPQLEVGSVLSLLGDEGGERIAPQDWAQATGTIPWEIVCGFKHRLPRLHLGEAERDR